MAVKRLATFALIVAVICALSGITLLLLSGWFIAASALAGLSLTLVSFNYLLPAAAIRMLAIARIAAGYGEKTLGHAVLLRRLQQLRRRLFGALMHGRATDQLRGEQLQILAEDVDVIGNQWLSVITPLLAVLAIVSLITAIILILTPPLVMLWVIVVVLSVLLMISYGYACQRNLRSGRALRGEWRGRLEHDLYAAPLWPLLTPEPLIRSSVSAEKYRRLLLRQRLLEGRYMALLTLIAGIALAALFVIAPIELAALLMVPVMALLSYPDWFANALRGADAMAAAAVSRQHIEELSDGLTLATPALGVGCPDQAIATRHQATTVTDIETDELRLQGFRWCFAQRQGPAVSARLRRGQLVWLKGSSGSGKSSLMLALAGSVHYQGEAFLGSLALQRLTSGQRHDCFNYVEQFPYLLSATLADNLRVAKPDASDAELIEVLERVQLGALKDQLSQWIGECGRMLSGGESKRLGIARAMLYDAPIWLLDEPFEGLDQATVANLLMQLENAKSQRLILIASHIWPATITPDQVIDLDQSNS